MKKTESAYRTTKQRQKILELLTNTKEHPTADQIYKKIKSKYCNKPLSKLNHHEYMQKIEHICSVWYSNYIWYTKEYQYNFRSNG